jgi:hypothetical protein
VRIRSAETPQPCVGGRLLIHCFQYFLPPVALSEPWGGRCWGGGEAMAIGIVSQFLGREARRAQGGVLDGHGIRGTVSLGLDDSNPCPSWLTRDHDGRQGVVPILRPRPSAPSRRLKAILRTQPGLRGIGPALGPPRGANAQIAVCSTSTRRRQAGVTWPSRRRWRLRQTWPSAAALGGWLCKVGGGRPAAVVEAPPVAGLKGCGPEAPRA